MQSTHIHFFLSGCDTGFGYQTAIKLCDDGFTVFAGCLDSQSDECAALKEKTKNPDKVMKYK